ncbi:MAG TPA: family 10 glycosylhydrolase, partial [Herpetosiphonaceae bacterium]|nr:family 10 glycosylhydrolase [Herpetosiphonaceae bacterium]
MRLVILLLVLGTLIIPVLPAAATAPQLRAFWVDAFHEGFKTPQQTDRLVADAVRAGANTLIVQVRRRADSYFRDSAEPIAGDVAAGYDPLADLLGKAHARGLKVHGWAVALPAWKDGYDQPDRSHVWYTHGPSKPGAENWFMVRDDGRNGDCAGPNDCSYFLDPGHPAAADYTVNALLRLVTRYDLDGLHLDYIRYPSNRFGYNPVSLQRFQQASGRGDKPAPEDPQWMQWRRDQVTKLVKRIYLNMLAHKPTMELSVAAIAWGAAPPNGDWKQSSPYLRTLQDWAGWLDAGYIDWALPMIYAREGDAQQQGWYNGWVDWAKMAQGRRPIAIGVGAWLNNADENLAQLRRATADGTLLGAGLYSYALPVAGDRNAFLDRLRQEVWSDGAVAPDLGWKKNPQTGFLLGRALANNTLLPYTTLRMAGPDGASRFVTADGSGVFGDVGLTPGSWVVTGRDPATDVERGQPVEVVAGRVTHLTLEVAAPMLEERLAPAEPDRGFGELWNRTDLPVARGGARSWMWGPKSLATGSETYAEAPGGRRVVQYWDKSRMEVTNPSAERKELWFVTNGLLAKELVSGAVQTGVQDFVARAPAMVPVAGDPAGLITAPPYAAFREVASLNGDRRVDQRIRAAVVQTLDSAGLVGSDAALGRYNVTNAQYNAEVGHHLPNVFTAYLNELPLEWVFVMGYPITEPYWVRAGIRGQATDVLVQIFERRVLTYTPSNPAAFRVEMGNVGQHYFRWRYNAAPWEQ